MTLYTVDALRKLSEKPQYTRNFCVVAHVDHGKTTLSDYLVASNGVLSPQLAGEVRLMDSRPDEQERRITMKASSIALCHSYAGVPHVCNLVDSPGHIDFSCEVSTAMRLCDGALVLVDVVDGVTQQTCTILRQAYREGLSMCLVLNKIDLLITAQQLSAEEAYVRMRVVIETCNAMLAAYANQMKIQELDQDMQRDDLSNDVWFDPCKGNVLFCSCYDAWAFDVPSFAKLYRDKLPHTLDLNQSLWGEYYLDGKTKTITTTPRRPDQAPLAVQLMLEPLWKLYNVFLLSHPSSYSTTTTNSNNSDSANDAMAEQHMAQCIAMANKLGIAERVWNSPRRDGHGKLKALLAAWLPLARCVLDAVCSQLDSSVTGQQRRLPALMTHWSSAAPEVRQALQRCDTAADAPCIVYLCKLIDTQYLVGRVMVNETNDHSCGSAGQSAVTSRMSYPHEGSKTKVNHTNTTDNSNEHVDCKEHMNCNMEDGNSISCHASCTTPCDASGESSAQSWAQSDAAGAALERDGFVGFARIYSGRLRVGQRVYIHSGGPSSTPNQPPACITVREVYMFRGIGLEATAEMCAGMLCGIGGVTRAVTKYATLTSVPHRSPCFRPLVLPSTSIVRLSVFPRHPAQLPALELGLAMLHRVDPQVEVSILPTGEHVLGSAGEVHAERCLRDLRDTFAHIEIAASEPLVTFRETIASSVNARARRCTTRSADGRFGITLYARALPAEVWELMSREESHHVMMRMGSTSTNTSSNEGVNSSDDCVESCAAGDGKQTALARRVAALLRRDRRFAHLLGANRCEAPVTPLAEEKKGGSCEGVIAFGPSRLGFVGAVLLMDLAAVTTRPPSCGNRQDRAEGVSPAHHAVRDNRVCAEEDKDVKGVEGAESSDELDEDANNSNNSDSITDRTTNDANTNKRSDFVIDGSNNTDNNSTTMDDSNVNKGECNEDDDSLCCDTAAASRAMFDTWRESIVAGFQAAVESGPMAQEPLFGIAFVITELHIADATAVSGGVVLACVRDACRAAMERHPRRLVEPVYECVVYSFGATQGKIYASLSRRRAEIVEEVPNEGSDLFYVRAWLPAVEAFGLQDELRVHTQGASTAQLKMSHWQVVEADPYFVPTTREEIEEHGAEVATKNIAATLLERIRRRKGLYRERTVANAEKQKFSLKGA